MQKLSSDKIAEVLADTQQVLLAVCSERDKLAAEVSQLRMRADAEKLASTMHEKGVHLDTPFESLVEDLEKAASEGRFSVIKEAVDMMAPNMGLNASLRNDDVGGTGASALETFLLG